MKRAREDIACSLCSQIDSTVICSCLSPPTFLCKFCMVPHVENDRKTTHEFSPIEIRDFVGVPGYKESWKKRQRVQEDAARKLLDNLRELGEWKLKMTQEIDHMIARLIELRCSVQREMDELAKGMSQSIDEGVQEFKEKIADVRPYLISPIAKALWNYDNGPISLLSCQTDFAEVRRVFEGYLFSLNIYLQTELVDYEPQGLIKEKADIRLERKVNVYRKFTADFTIPMTERTKNKLEKFSQSRSPTFVIKRGPIAEEGGVYFGEWSQLNEPHGLGRYQLTTGDKYIGECNNDQFHGEGIMVVVKTDSCESIDSPGEAATVSVYTGEFHSGNCHGFGCYESEHPTRGFFSYIGEFRDSKFDGWGIELNREGPIYAGAFKAGNRHGKGFLYMNGKASRRTFRGDAKW